MAVDFQIRDKGPGAIIVAYCDECKSHFEITHPTLSTYVKHCGYSWGGGVQARLPERLYEAWCDARDNR